MPIIDAKDGDQMKSPERITIALDEDTAGLFKKLREDLGLSQSELMREALKFYGKHRSLFDLADNKKVYTHAEMLSAGEHVILDIDHWILFLNLIESHPDKEKFWELHKEVSRAHAEQFKHKLYNAESIVKRLEICNLFQMSKTSKAEFTLIFGSELSKKFIKIELEEIFKGMGFMVDVKEDFSKLRLKVIHDL
ncbi:MAG: ribbon-helix-helix protein, CopG family [Methanotrichaceae archaeon]|nr:ribbon-helix-helix protein, CopG family [Methanotrichaceae archaeon]